MIYPKFAHLIRKNSKFWSVSGIKATIGVFDGVEIEANSLKSIIKGGINVATPTEYKSKVKNGHNFNLFLKADEDWLEWSPTIKPN